MGLPVAATDSPHAPTSTCCFAFKFQLVCASCVQGSPQTQTLAPPRSSHSLSIAAAQARPRPSPSRPDLFPFFRFRRLLSQGCIPLTPWQRIIVRQFRARCSGRARAHAPKSNQITRTPGTDRTERWLFGIDFASSRSAYLGAKGHRDFQPGSTSIRYVSTGQPAEAACTATPSLEPTESDHAKHSGTLY
eukprot:464501-Rhodomonas_salina.1